MRELNQKIYEIAEMESPSDENSVSIGQVITDNILAEEFDQSDNTLSREEADKVIKEERESIYGREKTNPQTITNLKIKQAFGTTEAKTKTNTKVSAKKAGSTGKTQIKKVSKKSKKSGKKAAKKKSNNTIVLLIVLLAAAAAYYFLEMQ